MNNKRRRRKTVLDLNSTEANLNATSSQACSKNNGAFGNSLTHLLEQYNSDSDEEMPEVDKKNCLNDKVNDFLAEIQCIAPKNDALVEEHESKTVWQECFDESTGYPYYWHIETNQVTWELPQELQLSRKNGGSAGSSDARPHAVFTRKLPVIENITKEVVARRKQRKEDADPAPKRSSTHHKNDSEDGKIEMITSFGSDNSESDASDENDENSKEKSRKTQALHSPRSLQSTDDDDDDDGDNCSRTNLSNDEGCEDVETVLNEGTSSLEKTQKNSGDSERELKFSLVPGYADDSENEDNLSGKKRVEPLFPSAMALDSPRIPERASKIDISAEESVGSQVFDSQETSTEDNRIPDKNDDLPKTNKFLETLGTSTKAFQRKRRIAFDVTMNKMKKCEDGSRYLSDAEATAQIIRGNDERLGFGFSKTIADDADPLSNSSEDSPPAERKEISTGKSSMGFVRGETLVLNQNSQEAERQPWTPDTQTIAEKLKFLSEGSPMASAVQIMNIQLQTLLTAWESGDLKDRYFSNWLTSTSRELCRLEKAAAPPGWDCQWDQTQKRYYYRNESSGETRWSYPDIIGGAEEMELCTTPPPPELEEKEKSPEPQLGLNREPETINQPGRSQDDRTSNTDSDKSTDQQYNHNFIKTNNTDENKTEKIASVEPKSPTPPPPPRICAEDLKRNRKKRRDATRQNNVIKNSKQEEIHEEKTGKESIEETDIPKVEITPEDPTITPVQLVNPLLLAPTSSHAEPLPPGVDQPEMPYAIAAAAIEPSVIFSTAAQQANASIYAATMPDPTNISIIGHHHPALVQNQLVHYPAYHSHLQNQAILAAANRIAGPEAVQFMLDYTQRIYANSQVITKPPVKMHNEALGTALDSFYNDIASLESQPILEDQQQSNHNQVPVLPMVSQPQAPSIIQQEPQIPSNSGDSSPKDKKKKKVKIVVSKKQKQVSSMVAKWKKAQNYEGSN